MKKTPFGIVLVLFVTGALLQFCVQPPDYTDAPTITFKTLTKDTLLTSRLGNDSTSIILSYTDGDGDLGSAVSDTSSRVFLIDSRNNQLKAAYALPYVEEQGAGNGISGDISIVVNKGSQAFKFCCIYDSEIPLPPCELENPPQKLDTMTFKIYLTDRAGHKSNVVETAPIILICDQ